MFGVLLLGLFVSGVIAVTNEGNLHLMEEEIAAAIETCNYDVDKDTSRNQRQRRSKYTNETRSIDNDRQSSPNLYDHKRRNVTIDTDEKLYVLNATDYDHNGYNYGNVNLNATGNVGEEKLVNDAPRWASNRSRRHEPLIKKPDADQCLSQCIFANLQVVDSRGIPREVELWNKVQASVTSHQSRAALRDQLKACFQELQSEAEDDGCSYSNKLERCLMLQFADRKIDTADVKKTT